MITKEDIIQAHERIKLFIKKTPVLTSVELNEMVEGELFFKCENLQEIGAFKSRGAMNAILSLKKEDLEKGVATHSSGNHAQALARAAKLLKVSAYIVMPSTAPEIKKKGVRYYGGEIFECEPNLPSRESTLANVILKTGATEIHPFNNIEVITGQATAGKELLEEIKNIDSLICPVGGGGLLSGTILASQYFGNGIVYAAEPEGADDTYRSMQTGKIEPSQSNTIADGLLTSLGFITFSIIHKNVTEVITVSDTEIITAMKLVWEKLKIIVEPSGVVPLAAVLKRKKLFKGKKTGIIFSGGNVDLKRAFSLFESVS